MSFDKVASWVEFIRTKASTEMVVYLVGNKIDLASAREVPADEAQKYAAANNMSFIEISAKADDSSQCTEVFRAAANQVLQKIQNGVLNPQDASSGVKIGPLHADYKQKANRPGFVDMNESNGMDSDKWCACLGF